MSLRHGLGFILILTMVGCSSTPVQIPATIEKPSKTVRVSLKAKGKLLLSQEIRRNMLRQKCREFSRRFQVSVKSAKHGTRYPMHASCRVFKGRVVVYPRKFLPPGDYLIEISRKQSWRYFFGKPKLLVRYLNPDFNSDMDQVPSGALTLAKGAKAEGEVNYSEGDRTDWYMVDGENSMVSLTLVGNGPSGAVSGAVYRMNPGDRKPRRLGFLLPGKSKSFRLGKSNLYFKVQGRKYSGPVGYSVVRRDFPITRVISVPVIDSYRVSDSTSMLLLEAVEGLKVEDQLSVKGKRLDGRSVSLGQCLITSVHENQASCRLPKVPKVNIVELTAQARIQGS